jgi:hypothetical protein
VVAEAERFGSTDSAHLADDRFHDGTVFSRDDSYGDDGDAATLTDGRVLGHTSNRASAADPL